MDSKHPKIFLKDKSACKVQIFFMNIREIFAYIIFLLYLCSRIQSTLGINPVGG